MLVYWGITGLGLLPARLAFNEYYNPLILAWNWSFLPLDLALSTTGLLAIAMDNAGRRLAARSFGLISLSLCFSSGLMAISFWALRREFDVAWWLVNSYLVVYPLAYLRWAAGDR